MWAWETTPASVAHGILDDETYDWLPIAGAMRATGGAPLVVGEEVLVRAHALARAHAAIPVSATGTAGLAGVLAARPPGAALVLFSGVER
jgi:threonine synthase